MRSVSACVILLTEMSVFWKGNGRGREIALGASEVVF